MSDKYVADFARIFASRFPFDERDVSIVRRSADGRPIVRIQSGPALNPVNWWDGQVERVAIQVEKAFAPGDVIKGYRTACWCPGQAPNVRCMPCLEIVFPKGTLVAHANAFQEFLRSKFNVTSRRFVGRIDGVDHQTLTLCDKRFLDLDNWFDNTLPDWIRQANAASGAEIIGTPGDFRYYCACT